MARIRQPVHPDPVAPETGAHDPVAPARVAPETGAHDPVAPDLVAPPRVVPGTRSETVRAPSRREEPDAAAARAERGRRRAAARKERPQGMVPGRERRRTGIERGTMRIISTGGIVGIATVLGAILVSQSVAGWIVGLAVGVVSVVLAAVLWSSRQL